MLKRVPKAPSPVMPALLAIASALVSTALAADAAAISAEAPKHIFQWRPFLAPFHAVVLHFPIGFITAAFLLEAYRMWRPSEEIRRVTVMMLWLSLLTGIISATFGLMRAGSAEYEAHMLALHKIYGLFVPVATIATLGLQRLAHRRNSARGWTYGYRAVLMGTISLVVVAGHYGGNLTHGSKYLVENAPVFLREFLEGEEGPATTPASPLALDEKSRLYTEKVQPILSLKCHGCHGPEKQKGGYRLDKAEFALKGGESGNPGIKPGDPAESHVVKLILLPTSHDDAMPPEGKQPLTSEEIMTIIDWIRNGAVFPEAGQALKATNTAG